MNRPATWALIRGIVTVSLTLGCALLIGLPTLQRVLQNRRVEARVFQPIPEGREHPPLRNVSGSSSAELTIIEFRDYTCGFCAAAKPILDSIVGESNGRVAVSVRHLPVRSRPGALSAAIAAECSARQSRLAEYADLLWANRSQLDSIDFVQAASVVGISNTPAFANCLEVGSSAWAQLVDDSTVAEHFKVQGTPTFIVGRTIVNGLPTDHKRFRLEVSRALAGKQ